MRWQELVQRRIDQAHGDGLACHHLKDALEVLLLDGKQAVQRVLPRRFVLGQDHLLNDRQAILLEEHMLRSAQADTLRAELDGLLCVARIVSVRADSQCAVLVCPYHQLTEGAAHFGRNQFQRAQIDVPGRTVHRDRVTLFNDSRTHGCSLRLGIDFNRFRPGHAGDAETARYDRRVGGFAAANVFLDDDPRECEEIRARLPEVVTLRCPSDSRELPRFLEHLWACDQPFSTAEDRARTELYREEARRREEIADLASPRELLERLQLVVAIDPAAPGDCERIAQLTQRTTQFNASGVKRTPAELRDLLARGELRGLAVRVRDRFGDYGLVGAILFRAGGGTLTAETFLLSCRALGRHVENAMLAELARRGRALGCSRLEIPVVETARNVPLREFCAALAETLESASGPGDGGTFSCSAEEVLRLARERRTAGAVVLTDRSPRGLMADGPSRPAVPGGAGRPGRSEVLQRIATELATADGILAASGGAQPVPDGPLPERDADVASRVTAIWTGVLRAGGFGPDDDFFDLGGDSLGAVEVLLEIHRQLGVDIPMTILFSDRFTVNRLRDVIENGALDDRGLLDWDAPVSF